MTQMCELKDGELFRLPGCGEVWMVFDQGFC